MLIAHLSHPHLRPPGELYQGLVDSTVMFDAAIRHLNTLDPPPDLVIITGDIVDHGTPAKYDHARTALSAIQQPVLMLPVIVTLVTSFKSPAEIARNPSLWIEAPTLANYVRVFANAGRLDMVGYLVNSLAAATIGTVVAIVLAFPAAYAIARSGIGRQVLMPLIVNLRAMPLVIFAIPIYMMFQWAGVLDTRLGLGLALGVVNLPLTLVLILNGVEEVPFEIEEAAMMDGATRLSRMLRVVAPLCRRAFVTAFVFGFITAWNEFLFGLILTTRDAVPVTVGASFFFASGGGGVQWGVASAVMVLAALPPVILGSVLYRYLAGSLAGAVKG